MKLAYHVTVALALLLGALVVAPAGCAKAPPNLSPVAVRAYHAHELVRALDVIRDVAQDANAQTPTPLLSTEMTRTITEWHRAALVVIQATPEGWLEQVRLSTGQVYAQLTPDAQHLLYPYFTFANLLIAQAEGR